VLALSYHVDYWNYRGWVRHAVVKQGQHRAPIWLRAKPCKRKNVYTPQAVINGRDHANGANEAAVIARTLGQALRDRRRTDR
jgi:hypothetical protein